MFYCYQYVFKHWPTQLAPEPSCKLCLLLLFILSHLFFSQLFRSWGNNVMNDWGRKWLLIRNERFTFSGYIGFTPYLVLLFL